MFFIFRWLFISLRSWGCGSWQMSAQQQPSLSLSSLSLSVSLSLFYRFVFSFFPTCMALSLFPHTFCLSISSLALLCISLELFDSLYRSVHNKKKRLSLKVWILRSYFPWQSHSVYVCVRFMVCPGDGVKGRGWGYCALFRPRELIQADGKCLHAY